MKAWALGGVALVTGFAVYNLFPKKAPGPPAPEPAPVVASAPTPPPVAEPAPLPPVVSVTDIDGLLDHPAPPPEPPFTPGIIAVGYEEWKADGWFVAPEPRPVEPEPIPPAADDAPSIEVAPPPREIVGLPAGETANLILSEQMVQNLAIHYKQCRFELSKYYWERKAHPIARLFYLTDADLTAKRAEEDWAGVPGWLPEPPTAQPDRVGSLFRVADQAPASRLDWYDYWHGTGQLPKHLADPAPTGPAYLQQW